MIDKENECRHNSSMMNFKLLMTLFTLSALIYSIMQIKFFLNDNFIERDTKLKAEVNRFLNGNVN
ncbi:MAG: hypothetical protein CME62_14775 [Halobacteriovoraceae bacterium]|nr:hypothetical protein [Halobacteriovoraceae bacterium]